MEVDCFISIYIREIIFTLCISISLSPRSYSVQRATPERRLGWENNEIQHLQQTLFKIIEKEWGDRFR